MADRLSELEHEGLVSKKIYPEIPPKVEYRLTLRAKELRVIFKELGTWASRWKYPGLQPKQNPDLVPDQLARAGGQNLRPLTDPRTYT